jgi:hypothetical protein
MLGVGVPTMRSPTVMLTMPATAPSTVVASSKRE